MAFLHTVEHRNIFSEEEQTQIDDLLRFMQQTLGTDMFAGTDDFADADGILDADADFDLEEDFDN